MENILKQCTDRMQKSIVSFGEELNALRTGRASPALFDKIQVTYYNTPTPLKQVANISIPEARLIVIQPWDKTLIGEIEKSIQKSNLSLNPSNDGKIIRIAIPPLTEERRKELVKQAKHIAEQSRIAIRNIRRDCKDIIANSENQSEDEKTRGENEIQKLTDKFIQDINSILSEKEKEIMTV